jgi:hypothetical protein
MEEGRYDFHSALCNQALSVTNLMDGASLDTEYENIAVFGGNGIAFLVDASYSSAASVNMGRDTSEFFHLNHLLLQLYHSASVLSTS